MGCQPLLSAQSWWGLHAAGWSNMLLLKFGSSSMQLVDNGKNVSAAAAAVNVEYNTF